MIIDNTYIDERAGYKSLKLKHLYVDKTQLNEQKANKSALDAP